MATLGNIDITNISLGNSEVSSISLGEIEVYSTGPTSPWRFVGLDDNLERASGTSVTCYGLYKYRGSDTDIEIPSEFNELPVRTIEPDVFKNNNIIESVVIPDSIIELRESCFENATVVDITFGDGIDFVGDKAFYGCTNLENVVLPDNEMYIGREVFINCTSLQYTYLGNVAHLGDDNSNYRVFENATGEVIFGAGSTITDLYSNPFYNFKGTKIVLSNSLTSIAADYYYSAFWGCSNLVSLTVPFIGGSRRTATQTWRYPLGAMFGTGSFTGATATEQSYYKSSSTGSSTYYIPDSLKEVIITDCTYLSYGSFYNCRYLTDIVLADNITSIGGYAFASCTNLLNITLPASLTSIESTAFSSGSRVRRRSYYYKGTLENWCNVALASNSANPMYISGWNNYESACNNRFYILDAQNGYVSYKNNSYSLLTKITIPSSITTINKYQFCGFSCLTSVTINNTVSSIGTSAFQYCSALVEVVNHSNLSITKSSSNGYIGNYAIDIITDPNYESQVTIDNNLFVKYISSSTNLTYLMKCAKNEALNIVIPDNQYDVIYNSAFMYYDNLLGITIGTGITTIGNSAFYSCSSITSVSIANDIKTLPQSVFSECSSLITVTGGSAIETISASAFYQCSSLETFPAIDSLKTIGNNAFSYCSNLESIYLGNSLTSLGQYFISRSSAEIIWGDNLSITSIPNNAFSEYYGDSIIIPSNITSINTAWGTATEQPSTYTKVYYDGTLEDWCRINFSSQQANPMRTDKTFYLLDENGLIEYQDKHYTAITDLVIPNTITSINRAQFYQFDQLNTVTIPDNITSIGEYAFAYSNATFIFSGTPTITTIGANAFQYYSKTNINLPNSVTSIGNYAFADSNLTDLPITNQLTTIGNYAFQNCIGLTSVRLPNTVTTLGTYAFNGCSNITYAILSSGLTRIQTATFLGCTSLVTIVLPNTITTLGADNNPNYGAFYNCTSLENVYYKGTAVDWLNVTIVTTSWTGSVPNSPMYYASNFYILDENGSVTYDGDTYSLLTEVEIPSGTSVIKSGQFYGFTHLESLTIPDSVTSIGSSFVGRSSCEIIWGENPGVTTIGDYTFYNYKGTSLDLPNITSIGEYAFENCTELISLTVPDTVTSIGKYAFAQCENLVSIHLPNGITTLNYAILDKCHSLATLEIPSSVTSIGGYAFRECTSLTSVVVPEGVTSFNNDYSAFYNCSGLTSVSIPSTVTRIPSGLFYGCGALVSMTLPFVGGAAYVEATDNYQYPFGYIFSATEFPGSVRIRQAYIKTRSSGAVDQNYYRYIPSSLRNITITGGSQIQFGAFCNCNMLTSISIPSSATFIGNNAFYSCSSLTSITIPNSVTSIGMYAFIYCSGLTSVTLSTNITQLQYQAFYSCSNLTSIALPEGLTTLGEQSLASCSKLAQITLPSTLTEIGNSVFSNDTALTSLSLPEGLTTIGNTAFNNCSRINQLVIPNSVTSIGSSAFQYCTFDIVWKDNPSIATITQNMFTRYEGATIPIPASVTSIENYAFSYCSNLNYLVIPSTVTTIANNAFYYNLDNLTRIDLLTTNTDTTYLGTVYSNVSGATPTIYVKSVLMDKVLNELSWDPERVGCLDPVNPESITITNDSSYQRKMFTLTAELDPIYANINNTITFSIISGNEYVTFDSTTNTVVIHEGVENQTIRVRATTGLNNSLSDEKDITITYVDSLYAVNLTYHGAWVDSNTTIDGNTVYKSSSSYHISNAYDTARITIVGYETFRFYVRSYGENCCDYIVVNLLDYAFNSDNPGSNCKMTTQSIASSSVYTEVVFDNIDGGEHFINITYRKDGSLDSNDDRGYFYIPAQ